jgi:hypothetical protein
VESSIFCTCSFLGREIFWINLEKGEVMRKVIALIQRMAAERFFGSVTLRFENGRIRHIKVEQVFQASDFS